MSRAADAFPVLPFLFVECRACKFLGTPEQLDPNTTDRHWVCLSPSGEACLARRLSPMEVKVMEKLVDGGPLTRDQLVQKLKGVPRTTIYDALKKLIMRHSATKYPFYETGQSRGRPKVLFSALGRD